MSEIKPAIERIKENHELIAEKNVPKILLKLAEYEAEERNELRAAYEALENERDELKQSLDDLQERFNGIKFIESELRKELEEFEVERNRREEMRKALEAQMGVSNKWQS